eukprot:TRINITY_DN4781_c0_g3_i1.p1 TRINITY_DN4781_c0_g3~~TRINITY_DN4781_c0_g3_i1.p1  ORF type:complete len:266 (+),score=12.54 TRINITY_DN4781_c0_g3_i1:1-798(+)
MGSLAELGEDLLSEVFRHLSFTTLLTVRILCKQYLRLASCDRLWELLIRQRFRDLVPKVPYLSNFELFKRNQNFARWIIGENSDLCRELSRTLDSTIIPVNFIILGGNLDNVHCTVSKFTSFVSPYANKFVDVGHGVKLKLDILFDDNVRTTFFNEYYDRNILLILNEATNEIDESLKWLELLYKEKRHVDLITACVLTNIELIQSEPDPHQTLSAYCKLHDYMYYRISVAENINVDRMFYEPTFEYLRVLLMRFGGGRSERFRR